MHFPHIIYIIYDQKQTPANQNAVHNHVPAQMGIQDHQLFDASSSKGPSSLCRKIITNAPNEE